MNIIITARDQKISKFLDMAHVGCIKSTDNTRAWQHAAIPPLLFFNNAITAHYCLVPKKKKTNGACNTLQTSSLARPLSFTTALVESVVESQEECGCTITHMRSSQQLLLSLCQERFLALFTDLLSHN